MKMNVAAKMRIDFKIVPPLLHSLFGEQLQRYKRHFYFFYYFKGLLIEEFILNLTNFSFKS